MAESVLSFAQNLALMISNEAEFLSGVEDQAQSLCNEIRLMSSTLRDASEKRRTGNHEVEEWLNQVRDVVMKAEDVIDLFIFRAERQRHQNILTRYISYPKQLFNLHNLGKDIENSIKKMNHLSVRRSTLGLATSEATQSSISNEVGLPFRRGDRVEEFCVIGFQEEENEIVKNLLTPIEPPRTFPTVVSIVGMGGSGKTTLARKIYKRNDIKKHFPTRAWISVSQQYRIKDLLQVIIEQVKPLTPEEKKELDSLDVESLIHKLSCHLIETTYLIVFDDLWRIEDWNMLKQALPVQDEGYQSRVLITTRNEIVARSADPSTTPYFQRLLDEDESWELFLTKMMISKDVGFPQDLEDLGWQIVHKCHGLPLAIVVLGGLLSIKPRTRIAWHKVLDSVNWELNQNEGNCRKVLTLSYIDLPDHLKPCFLYLGLFPEDHEIRRCRLIWLWVAEGFIQPREHLTMEDVAEDYLEELIQRSMIQATVRSYDGRVTFCRIHDLVRDLAISEAKQERFLEVLGSDKNKPRRLSIIEPTGGGMPGTPTNAPNERTITNHPRSLLCFSRYIEGNMWMKSSYGAMKLLRVLDLERMHLSSISSRLLEQIGKLILLKYLSLRYTDIDKLPSSIGDLQNLQTIDLCFTDLTQLPMTTMKLQQLRNLVFSSSLRDGPLSFDCPLDHMTNLQTLMLNEGKWMERLDKLTNLRALCIHLYTSPSPYQEALLNAIPKLNHLRGFSLSYFGWRGKVAVVPASFSNHSELSHIELHGIVGIRVFPTNLTTLILKFQRGQEREELMANLEKHPKLRCLILISTYKGSKIIFSTDGFCQLEELALIQSPDLEEFVVEEGALPNLRVLRILNCSKLKRLPRGLKQMATLQELSLKGMSKELELRLRKDTGEDWEIIKHIPSVETKSQYLDYFYSKNFERQWC